MFSSIRERSDAIPPFSGCDYHPHDLAGSHRWLAALLFSRDGLQEGAVVPSLHRFSLASGSCVLPVASWPPSEHQAWHVVQVPGPPSHSLAPSIEETLSFENEVKHCFLAESP